MRRVTRWVSAIVRSELWSRPKPKRWTGRWSKRSRGRCGFEPHVGCFRCTGMNEEARWASCPSPQSTWRPRAPRRLFQDLPAALHVPERPQVACAGASPCAFALSSRRSSRPAMPPWTWPSIEGQSRRARGSGPPTRGTRPDNAGKRRPRQC